MGFAYVQWLWMTLKKTEVSIGTLNSAFSARSSLLFIFNWEMIRKIKVGSLIALAAWYKPFKLEVLIHYAHSYPGVFQSRLFSPLQRSSLILRTPRLAQQHPYHG
jgi:hypothetical protein